MKKKIRHCVQYCVQCGEKLEPLDNLDSGEHINPKICIQNLRVKIVRMSETFLSGCLVLNSDPTVKIVVEKIEDKKP
jgi:hypothetical protein